MVEGTEQESRSTGYPLERAPASPLPMAHLRFLSLFDESAQGLVFAGRRSFRLQESMAHGIDFGSSPTERMLRSN